MLPHPQRRKNWDLLQQAELHRVAAPLRRLHHAGARWQAQLLPLPPLLPVGEPGRAERCWVQDRNDLRSAGFRASYMRLAADEESHNHNDLVSRRGSLLAEGKAWLACWARGAAVQS